MSHPVGDRPGGDVAACLAHEKQDGEQPHRCIGDSECLSCMHRDKSKPHRTQAHQCADEEKPGELGISPNRIDRCTCDRARALRLRGRTQAHRFSREGEEDRTDLHAERCEAKRNGEVKRKCIGGEYSACTKPAERAERSPEEGGDPKESAALGRSEGVRD